MRFTGLMLLLLASATTAAAQNSDLGLLGQAPVKYPRAGVQLNYARQLWENPAGRLYLELPVFAPDLDGHAYTFRFFFTPGLRYHFNVTHRIAIYVSAGGGFASWPARHQTNLARGLGGGLDYRLTRRWSLRADVRNLTTSLRFTSPSGRLPNNPVVNIGAGLHF